MRAREYHDGTKHHFHGFARSLGYLDWASQPDPFRRFAGAPVVELPRAALRPSVPYSALYEGGAEPAPLTEDALGEFLRCSLGLSAWKQYGASRWALRVNPSSGNLHPVEGYVLWRGQVAHYAPEAHALEIRCRLPDGAWRAFAPPDTDGFLVALSSITWREAWKYGERAYRYCQHDVGHAIGALRVAAALLEWRLRLLSRWSDGELARLLGIDRDGFPEGEGEEPACVAVVTPGNPDPWLACDPTPLAASAAGAEWHGTPSCLSPGHVDWSGIDEISKAARYPGAEDEEPHGLRVESGTTTEPVRLAREIILTRRSALGFDALSTLPRDALLSMLRRTLPAGSPWDAVGWPPQVHLALFAHRVDGLEQGIYAWMRDESAAADWQAAMRPEFLWEPVAPPLYLLLPVDVREAARRVSCNQEIAADGFLSLGMIARFEAPLAERGDWFYRRLFWECGLIGQVLYLESEAVGARSTGIGCFFDDPVHEMLGLSGHAWQSLYHFSMGVPVEDRRLTTEPGYAWE